MGEIGGCNFNKIDYHKRKAAKAGGGKGEAKFYWAGRNTNFLIA